MIFSSKHFILNELPVQRSSIEVDTICNPHCHTSGLSAVALETVDKVKWLWIVIPAKAHYCPRRLSCHASEGWHPVHFQYVLKFRDINLLLPTDVGLGATAQVEAGEARARVGLGICQPPTFIAARFKEPINFV